MSMKRRRPLASLASLVPLVPLAPLVLAAALALGGCATTAPYGNFVPSPVTVDQPPLATEAAKQLAALWPPARTRFALQQPTPDAFGTALVGQLRAAGYAVLEYGPATVPAAARAAQGEPTDEPAAGVSLTPAALPLRYVLDHDTGSGFYRLTLWVGTQSLTRAYLEQDGSLMAAGYWVRRE